MSGEVYAEQAVLGAILNARPGDAQALLADFLPNELDTFEEQAELLLEMIRAEARRKRVAS